MDAIRKAIAQSTATGWVANRFREAAGLPPLHACGKPKARPRHRGRGRYRRLMHQRTGALDRVR